MTRNFGRVQIDGSNYIHFDSMVIDRYRGEVIFALLVGPDALLKNVAISIKKRVNCYVENRGHAVFSGKYEVEREKGSDSDFTVMTIKKKDSQEKIGKDNENYEYFIYYRNTDEFNEVLYDKIYSTTSIPVLREWMPYISDRLRLSYRTNQLTCYYSQTNQQYSCSRIGFDKKFLLEAVQNGIRNNQISIGETRVASEIMQQVNGLDMYLNVFGDTLAEKIQQSFVPKFIPGESQYTEYVDNFDDACYYGGIEIYNAQKAVIQAAVNNLDKNKVTFVVGEMGTGKTAMASGIVYAHYKKKAGSTSVVVCPSHLIEKWKREVERLVPNAKGYIVENIEDMIDLEPVIKNKNKKEHAFLILSKEDAKFSYETRPAANWSYKHRCFVCPECGQPLYKDVFTGPKGNRRKTREKMVHADFVSTNADNKACDNEVKVWNNETSAYEKKVCGAKLWTPLNKYETNSKWIKMGKEGWLLKSHFEHIYNDYFERRTSLTKKEQEYLLKLIEKKNELEETGELTSSRRGVRKYSIAKYIRERLKGHIDYLILDEVHELKGEKSLQGQAMGNLCVTANKVLCLTGTLLNGYANGLYYILYRTMPQVMKAEGLEYKDVGEFQRTYGVVQRNSSYRKNRGGHRGDKIKGGMEKALPGVSPLVFTKFLLENAVFVSISDMADGLPEYTEIPLAVDMDEELVAAYETLESEMKRACGRFNGGMKIMGNMVHVMSAYPDMPYNCEPVLHPDTAEVICTPTELRPGLRNKEQALINLVKEKVAAGEKVLVYYQWTNKTDVAEKLVEALTNEGINAVDMQSGKVSSKKRESWIEKQLQDHNIDVLLCNPSLVKTGLDLLAFTTIVFYQMGYDIFTLRQASRRSWRLSQDNDIEVYFMYYKGTLQEQCMSLMASKLYASMALEGKFSEEGLRAMADNQDLLSQLASSVVDGIKNTVEAEVFSSNNAGIEHDSILAGEKIERERKSLSELLIQEYVRLQLEFLVKQVRKETEETPTRKTINGILGKKISIANLLSTVTPSIKSA